GAGGGRMVRCRSFGEPPMNAIATPLFTDSFAPLWERERPRSWEQVVGQDKVIRQLRQLESRAGLSGRAYWLSGQSGTGKTTIARLIAAAVPIRSARKRSTAGHAPWPDWMIWNGSRGSTGSARAVAPSSSTNRTCSG